MTKVKMKISGAQSTGNSEPQVTELTTEGVFEFTGDEFYYTYNESELSGMEGCTTTLITDGKKKLSLEGPEMQIQHPWISLKGKTSEAST